MSGDCFDGDIQKLRGDAESILKNWKDNEPCKPYFFEFSGTPKSGKSTCIEIVSHFFRRLDFQVLSPTEGASRRTPRHLRSNWFRFNIWSASYALTHILEGLSSPERWHIVILDRGLFDALVWFQLLSDRSDITCDELKRVHEFLVIDEWRKVIDGVFLFKTDTNTSLERENRDTLVDDQGSAMNLDTLPKLNSAYDSVEASYSDRFNVISIDTGQDQNTTPKGTAYQVARAMVDQMQGKS